MEVGQLFLSYIQALIWPCVVVFLFIKYHRVIEELIPRSKIKLTIATFTIETDLQTLMYSVEERLPSGKLSDEQRERLEILRKGRMPYTHESDYDLLRPLRNAGLIRTYPGDFLTSAQEVEITAIGKLVVEEWIRQEGPVSKTQDSN